MLQQRCGQGFAYCGNRNKHMRLKHSATSVDKIEIKVSR